MPVTRREPPHTDGRCWCRCHSEPGTMYHEGPLRTDAIARATACSRCVHLHEPKVFAEDDGA